MTIITLPDRSNRTAADWKYIVGLHGKTLEMNGAKTSPVLLKAAADAVAEYEAAKAAQGG